MAAFPEDVWLWLIFILVITLVRWLLALFIAILTLALLTLGPHHLFCGIYPVLWVVGQWCLSSGYPYTSALMPEITACTASVPC